MDSILYFLAGVICGVVGMLFLLGILRMIAGYNELVDNTLIDEFNNRKKEEE